MYYDVWYNVNIFYSKRQKKQDYAAQRVDGESAELTLIRFRLTENMVCWWFLTWKSSDKKDVYNSIQHITKQQQQKQQTKPHINFVVFATFFLSCDYGRVCALQCRNVVFLPIRCCLIPWNTNQQNTELSFLNWINQTKRASNRLANN